jgi:hypothetical protein
MSNVAEEFPSNLENQFSDEAFKNIGKVDRLSTCNTEDSDSE